MENTNFLKSVLEEKKKANGKLSITFTVDKHNNEKKI